MAGEIQITVEEQVNALQEVIRQIHAQVANLSAMNIILTGKLSKAEAKLATPDLPKGALNGVPANIPSAGAPA